jgi:sterol desaturase/sphingolipid hydroxylase (fatty acid hydroxylase superfamily)
VIFAATTLGLGVALNLLGLALSWRLDRDGLPAAFDQQVARRRLGSLPARVPLIAFNLLLMWVGGGAAMWYFAGSFPLTFPGWGRWLGELVWLLVVDDLVFYGVHRSLHEVPWLYRRIHKRHHEAFAPVPIEYLFVHPAEWMLGTLGLGLGVLGLLAAFGSVSAWSIWSWQLVRVGHELEIHSGLALWRLPFFAPMSHHDLHHARPNSGNYASMFTFWDRVLGTRAQADEPRRPRARAEPARADPGASPPGAAG